jgi:hypothetical protein
MPEEAAIRHYTFGLTPIDIAAFAYQLADLNAAVRFAARFLDLKFFSLRIDSVDLMQRDRPVIGMKDPPF